MSPSLETDWHSNGEAKGLAHRPKTPSLNALSLTEYSANPSPPNEHLQQVKFDAVPKDFLLPNGYPDVCRMCHLVFMIQCLLFFLQYLRLILTSRVYEVVEETPLTLATNLSNKLDCQVMLKREDLLPVFSFKLRGAYNKMAHLDRSKVYKGVVACSAGNCKPIMN